MCWIRAYKEFKELSLEMLTTLMSLLLMQCVQWEHSKLPLYTPILSTLDIAILKHLLTQPVSWPCIARPIYVPAAYWLGTIISTGANQNINRWQACKLCLAVWDDQSVIAWIISKSIYPCFRKMVHLLWSLQCLIYEDTAMNRWVTLCGINTALNQNNEQL